MSITDHQQTTANLPAVSEASTDEQRRLSKYRIFLSYRGETSGTVKGKEFAAELYKFLTEGDFAKDLIGDVYYSENEDRSGDFKHGLRELMSHIEYFVIPFTPDFFADFPEDDKDEVRKQSSITYLELAYALENPRLKFINVIVEKDKEDKKLIDGDLLVRLFGWEKAERITTVKFLDYTKNDKDTFYEIYQRIQKEKESFAEKVGKLQTNVYLDAKEELESDQFPLYSRLYDARTLTLLNFASSSFISGATVADSYEQMGQMKAWFNNHLIDGKINVNIILTDPHTPAAVDAARFKMYPEQLKISKDQIILSNLNKLFEFKLKYPLSNLHVYLTPVVLPYGVMMVEFNGENKKNNYMKVDLYAADIERDGKRPSFFLLEKDQSTKHMYKFFKDNIERIKNNDSVPYDGHPVIDWMERKDYNIVHRAVGKEDLVPHTLQAFRYCIHHELPIEVDLMSLSDGTVVVGRLDEAFALEMKQTKDGQAVCLGDLRAYNREHKDQQVLTLDEFLKLISGRIPLLIELKTENDAINTLGKPFVTEEHKENELIPSSRQLISQIIETIYQYSMNYQNIFTINTGFQGCPVAVHSADSRIVNMVNVRDCMIPSGVIVSKFEEKYDLPASPNRLDIQQLDEMETLQPDFVSYDIKYIKEGYITRIKSKLKVPVIAWTVKNSDELRDAIDYGCSTTVCELFNQ